MPERPKDLIYALDEKPPPLQMLALGFQHVAVICPYLVMVALVASAAKLPHAEARNAMAWAMIAVGFLTVLQSLRIRGVGSGYLCPPVVSAIYLPSSITAASHFGFRRLRHGDFHWCMGDVDWKDGQPVAQVLPRGVSGVVIIAVGIELGKIGLGVLLDEFALSEVRTELMAITALCVLVTMTTLAVWAKGLPRLLCALIGILVGYVISAFLGVFPDDFEAQLSASPVFALPDPRFISIEFEPSLMIPFAIAGLSSGLRVVGVPTTS